MKIIYKQGNLLDCEEDIIVHGVNCQGKMGRGVAKAIRDKWPVVYDYYAAYFTEGANPEMLGKIVIAPIGFGKYVINAFTQNGHGRNNIIVYVDYNAVRSCFVDLTQAILRSKFADKEVGVAMPKIGAGLANGDWEIISSIIEEESGCVWQPVIYEL